MDNNNGNYSQMNFLFNKTDERARAKKLFN